MNDASGAEELLLAEKLIGYDSSNEDGIRLCAGFVKGWLEAVSYTHLTLPTNREV